MKIELQEKLDQNFNKENIKNIGKLIEEPMSEPYRMLVDESGNGTDVKISEESRKICAKSLIR